MIVCNYYNAMFHVNKMFVFFNNTLPFLNMSDYKLYNCGNVENIRHELCRNLLQPKNHTCKLHSIVEQLHLLRFSGASVFLQLTKVEQFLF